MKTKNINFVIPEDVAELLRTRVDKRKRSVFITDAVREKLQELEQEGLEQSRIEGYQARRDEDARLNRIWEKSTLEDWW